MALAPIGLQHFLVLSAILFSIGMFGAISRSNAVGVLLSIELMLNAVNVMMVAFNCYVENPQAGGAQTALAGQLFAIFIMTVAAAEAAVIIPGPGLPVNTMIAGLAGITFPTTRNMHAENDTVPYCSTAWEAAWQNRQHSKPRTRPPRKRPIA